MARVIIENPRAVHYMCPFKMGLTEAVAGVSWELHDKCCKTIDLEMSTRIGPASRSTGHWSYKGPASEKCQLTVCFVAC